ncbi:hypothetical protein GLOIN_2v1722840, partial [Rhizophagus irregularis DAOM 181602=DAOM 197198]
MEDYVEKNNKSTSYTIMWENSKIYDLVKEMYDKTKETKETKEVINRDMIEKRNKEVRELYEQISRRQAELIKLIQKANNKLDELGKITGKSYMI